MAVKLKGRWEEEKEKEEATKGAEDEPNLIHK